MRNGTAFLSTGFLGRAARRAAAAQGPGTPASWVPRWPGPPRSPPHLSGPGRPTSSFLWGGGSGVSQGAGQGGGAVSQVGRQAPSLVRLGWDFSQTLCSPGRGSPTLCRSWRGSRPRPLSASRRSPPCLSLRRSPARSRCRSGWRSRSGRGCRSGSRSLCRARGSRVLDVSSMARSRVPAPERPEDNNPTASFPGRWPNLGGGARTAGRDGHLRARALAPPRPAARSPERAHRQEALLCVARGTAPGCRGAGGAVYTQGSQNLYTH